MQESDNENAVAKISMEESEEEQTESNNDANGATVAAVDVTCHGGVTLATDLLPITAAEETISNKPITTTAADFESEAIIASMSSTATTATNEVSEAGALISGADAVAAVSTLEEGSAEKDADSDEENDDETKENFEGFNGTGRTVTLQMLMGANVLQPGKSTMTIEYLGQKFVGDLLNDGKIKSQETETIFLTPSAWAMHCKRIINPEKKSGCGWASVKYKGKKLDAYKNSWLRKCALQKESTPDDETDIDKKSDSPLPVIKRTVFQHNSISNRNVMHDANMLIEAVPFSAVGKLQPFLLTLNSSALLLADFHCHLTMHEVCGYFGGTWDVNSHTLSITKSYPCRNTRFDRHKANEAEREIQKMMMRDQLILVGWYHSHPKFQAEPTLRDCDSQLDYQIRMRGPSDITYTPCVSLIISPYYDENPTLESVVKSIWVVPPNENKQSMEYGRPMLMQYSVLPDKEIPEEVRTEIQSCVDYYSQFRNEIVNFSTIFNEDTTFIEKLKNTLYPKFPVKQNDKALWNWICAVLDCEQEDDFIPPKTIKIIDNEVKPETLPAISIIGDLKLADILKEEEATNKMLNASEDAANALRKAEEHLQFEQQKASELKVMSLQEQLCMPSGLNMNPVRMLSPLATPNPTATAPAVLAPTAVTTNTPIAPILPPVMPTVGNLVTAPSTAASSATSLLPPLPPTIPLATNNLIQSTGIQPSVPPPPPVAAAVLPAVLSGVSPRDSPITIPSNSASPAKFELPVRASPSPAKSDTSSHTSRTRNSPAPSPGKFSISDIARNSPSITPNKYEVSSAAAAAAAAAAAGLMPPTSSACMPTANDLMAASLAQLAGQLAPNFLQSDIAAALFQQQRKDYGNSSLNQLAAAAAKVGGQKHSSSQSSASNSIVPSMTASSSSAGAGLADLTDPNVAAAVAAYSNSFNMPRMQEQLMQAANATKSKSERSSKSSSSSSTSSNSSTNSYKTKLMKELDDLKNDPLKMSELIRSPEYAALLLQQAEALGATTLGSLGFPSEFAYLTAPGIGMSSNNSNAGASNSSSNSKSKSAAASSAAVLANEYNSLIQATKMLGYDSYIQQQQQAKSNNDLNAFLQQQMAAAAAAASVQPPPSMSVSSSKKQQQQQAAAQAAHPDYTALLQTYSKLFDPTNQFGAAMAPGKGNSNAHHELSALLAAGVGMGAGSIPGLGGSGGSSSSSSSSKQKQKEAQQAQQAQQAQTEMLNQLLQSEKQQSDLNALIYHQNKAAAELNALFATPSGAAAAAAAVAASSVAPSSSKSGGSTANSTGTPSPLTDPAAYYNAMAQEKMQDYNVFFQQQHGKYGIPDPLSKSTLAANNLFMSPSALLKMQQESLSAMMMKPPKSTSTGSVAGMGRNRESSASPALERLTPTKSAGSGSSASSSGQGSKYNFSAVDLAISSVPSNTPSPALSDGSNSSSHRRPSNTPPVDLSRLYGELAPSSLAALSNAGATKKRMEFSSIADLVAPPPAKMPKLNDDVLNLSNE